MPLKVLVVGLRNARAWIRGRQHEAQGIEVLCAPEVFATAVTKGFKEVAERFMALQLTPWTWFFSCCGASIRFLTRYNGELREPLVWC